MMETDLSEIYNFLQISDKLGTAGQPTAEQFDLIQEAGYEVVINLGMPNQPHGVPNEAEIVADLGMTYIPIPVVWNNPTSENLERALDALDEHADKKVFIHCMANYRVSSFIFLYRVLRLGVPKEEAEIQLHQLWQPNDIWANFIEAQLESKEI